MDFATLVIAVLIFVLVYQGAGLFLAARQSQVFQLVKTIRFDSTSVTSSLRNLMSKMSQMGMNKALLRNKKFRERLERLLVPQRPTSSAGKRRISSFTRNSAFFSGCF